MSTEPAAVPPDAPASRATAPAGIPGEPCGCGCGRILCEWDACTHLTGRQERFASGRCRTLHYEHNFPRLGRPPVIPEGRSIDRLVELMADGRWRTAVEMSHETGTREGTVLRRIQESVSGRPGRRVARFRWESRVRAHSRSKEYRLALNGTAL